mgnify:CR=1 FL=1
MPRKGQILPSPCRVAVLVPDGARLIGLIGCLDAFDAANRVLAHANKPPIYTLSTLGLTTRVRSESGTVLATQRARELARVDTLIVGGSLAHIESPFRPRYLAEVSRLAQTARRVVSVCTGSFALGQLGLLDGRRCTSHWLALERMREAALRRHFRPEFLNRLDDIIQFHPLGPEHMQAILDIQLERLRARLADRELNLEVTKAAREALARRGYDPDFGARPLKRLLEQTIVDPLARGILEGRYEPGTRIVADVTSVQSADEIPAIELRAEHAKAA